MYEEHQWCNQIVALHVCQLVICSAVLSPSASGCSQFPPGSMSPFNNDDGRRTHAFQFTWHARRLHPLTSVRGKSFVTNGMQHPFVTTCTNGIQHLQPVHTSTCNIYNLYKRYTASKEYPGAPLDDRGNLSQTPPCHSAAAHIEIRIHYGILSATHASPIIMYYLCSRCAILQGFTVCRASR